MADSVLNSSFKSMISSFVMVFTSEISLKLLEHMVPYFTRSRWINRWEQQTKSSSNRYYNKTISCTTFQIGSIESSDKIFLLAHGILFISTWHYRHFGEVAFLFSLWPLIKPQGLYLLIASFYNLIILLNLHLMLFVECFPNNLIQFAYGLC